MARYMLLEKWYVSNFRIESGRNISDTGISNHLSVTTSFKITTDSTIREAKTMNTDNILINANCYDRMHLKDEYLESF